MRNVPNIDRKFGSADAYYLLWVGGEPLLATTADIARMRERAAKNPEDVQKRCSWPRRIRFRLRLRW